MEENIIPECYFDTLLVKTMLNVKNVNHQKSCFKVETTVKGIDDFALGIIDKDKKEIAYLKDFIAEITNDNLILWKHRTKQHYFIQLIPAIEIWILNAADESNLNIVEIGLPNELNKLKKITKQEGAIKNKLLINLCNQLIIGKSKAITTLSLWLNYLYIENRNADINKLKENV